MTLVKICGIKMLEHARIAAEGGADVIGFVFVPVRREIKPDAAAEIVNAVHRESSRPPAAVGLFVNEDADTINRVADQVGLDLVQLSGDEPPELAGAIQTPVIKVIRLREGISLDEARARIEQWLAVSDAVLIDSDVAGHWGGTGVVGDWGMAATLAAEYPVVLAGGLNPDNVGNAINQVNPAMVDVSSGVETDGEKDSRRIRAFLRAARAAEREPAGAADRFVELIHAARDAQADSGISV